MYFYVTGAHKVFAHTESFCLHVYYTCNFGVDKLSKTLIINLVLERLKTDLKLEWEKDISFNMVRNWKQFLAFLNKQCRIPQNFNEKPRVQLVSRNNLNLPFKSDQSI